MPGLVVVIRHGGRVTMKNLFRIGEGFGHSGHRREPGPIRIAFPSFGFSKRKLVAERASSPRVSREEIAALLKTELTPRRR